MEPKFSRRTGWRATLALLAALVGMGLGGQAAQASVTVNVTSVGAGTVLTGAGTTSDGYATCDKTANRDDRVSSACPSRSIPTATTEICIPFGGCTSFPVSSTLVLAAVPAPTPVGHWRFLRWDNCPGDTITTDNLCAIANGFVPTTATPRAVFDDFVGPTVTAITANFSTTLDRGVSFSGAVANEGLSATNCQIDGAGAFTPCGTVRQLSVGTHVVRAQGVDLSGNTGSTSAILATFPIVSRDDDGDGFNQIIDCNDANAGISPIAPDIAGNGVDENCDGADAVDPDRDDDGFQPPSDCNDDNPNIKPGVPDIADNNVDENCDGSDAKSPPATKIVVSMPFFVKKSTNKFTTFTQLQVKGIPRGSLLKVTCKAPKKKTCPGGKTFTKRNAGGTVNLSKWLKAKLPAGSKLTVTVTKPGNFIGAVKTMTIKKKARPSFVDRCAAPGTTKAVGC